MKKNIGIIMPSSKNGGVFQLSLSIAESLINYSEDYEYFLTYYDSENPVPFLNLNGRKVNLIAVPFKKISLLRKIIHFLGITFGLDFFLLRDFHEIFRKNNIDLLIFPTPSTFDFFPYKTPFVACIPNLMHRYYPNFPEFGLRQNITRDIVYKYYSKKSILNIVDAKQGANDILKFLGVNQEKSRISSYIPAGYIYKRKDMDSREIKEILADYNLPDKFLFYPAQFWFHKNHIRLVDAIHLVKEKYKTQVNIVFTGTRNKNYKKILSLAEKYNIKNQIFHLGYVSGREIVALYKKSVALVFPSLFGPTDIPCIEAMILGTPILCSNLFEIPKQVGSAGLLFNPFKTNEIAEKIYKVWVGEKLRKELVQNGYERTKNITLENYAKEWEGIIEEALKKT